MEHSFKSYICAFFSFLGVPNLLGVSQKSDLDWLLRVQFGSDQITAEALLKHTTQCYSNTKTRRKQLRQKTILSLIWVLSAVVIPLITFKTHFEISIVNKQQVFSLVSLVAFSWATLGRLGWTEKSYKGNTIYERLDTFIFWALYWVGIVCGVLALVN